MNTVGIVLKTSFAIIGTVIGAGFISGREIITFFKGDMLVSSILLCVIFFLAFYFLLTLKNLPDSKLLICFQPLILVGNLITLSGMISAVDEVFFSITDGFVKIPFFSVIILIFSYFLMKKGIGGLKIINTILVPSIIVVTLVITLIFSSLSYSVTFEIPTGKLVAYVGMNTFMSSTVFIDLGKDLNKKQALYTSLISSGVLCLFIFFIYSALVASPVEIRDSAVPMLARLKNLKVLYYIFSVIMLFGIVTTLFSAHYPLFCFAQTFPRSKIANAVVLIAAFAISRFGFYNIVNYLYPFLGASGAIYIITVAILSNISRRVKRQNT